MKLLIVLFLSILSFAAFSTPKKEKYWLRLCDFGNEQSKLQGWQKQIGDIKYVLVKDEIPLIGYSDKGIFYKDKKICDWKEVTRSSQDKKKYRQSDCLPGTPLEVSEISDDDKKKKKLNRYGSHEKYLIKLSVDDLWIPTDKLDEVECDYCLYSKINFSGDTFEFPVDKACESGGEQNQFLIKNLMNDKEFSALFNEWVSCFQKYPFCKEISEVKKNINMDQVYTTDDDFNEKMVSYFNELNRNYLEMASFSEISPRKIMLTFSPRRSDVLCAEFIKERESTGDKKKKLGKWKMVIAPNI